MNENVIFQILLSIVKQMPFDENIRQLKTFAVIQKLDLLSESLNSVQTDLNKGLFWSRDWVATGAQPSDRQAQYPMLVVRRLSIAPNQDRTNTVKYCQKFAVSVIDIDTKDDCMDCGRNDEEIKTGVFKILHNVKSNLLKYSQYTVQASGNKEIWSTPQEIEYLTENDLITGHAENYGTALMNHIKNISEFNFFDVGIDNATAIQMFFDFCGCEVETLDMNYAYTENDLIPVTKCATCE